MTRRESGIVVNVDVTNPGEFFACCGLLELADRLWSGAEGWFEDKRFNIEADGTLNTLIEAITDAELEQLDFDDDMASPLRLPDPFSLTLDWWMDDFSGGRHLKVWAGSMRSARIARAMQAVIADVLDTSRLFDFSAVVFDPEQRNKKVEPYYFDSRRGSNAQSLDIGFAPDSLDMTTAAFPVVEFLCLVGLQRFRPATTAKRRVFNYHTWAKPLPIPIATLAVQGLIASGHSLALRFENAFRTDQKKHKSFLPATPIGG